MAGDLKTKLARMEQIKREKPAYKNLLDFYEKIFIAKEEFYQSLKALPIIFDAQGVETKFKAGFPVLDKSAIELDSEAVEKFFHTLLQISLEKNPATAGKLAAFIKKGNLDVGKTIKAMWEGEIPSPTGKKEELGDPALLFFLLTDTKLHSYINQYIISLIKNQLWREICDHGHY